MGTRRAAVRLYPVRLSTCATASASALATLIAAGLAWGHADNVIFGSAAFVYAAILLAAQALRKRRLFRTGQRALLPVPEGAIEEPVTRTVARAFARPALLMLLAIPGRFVQASWSSAIFAGTALGWTAFSLFAYGVLVKAERRTGRVLLASTTGWLLPRVDPYFRSPVTTEDSSHTAGNLPVQPF